MDNIPESERIKITPGSDQGDVMQWCTQMGFYSAKVDRYFVWVNKWEPRGHESEMEKAGFLWSDKNEGWYHMCGYMRPDVYNWKRKQMQPIDITDEERILMWDTFIEQGYNADKALKLLEDKLPDMTLQRFKMYVTGKNWEKFVEYVAETRATPEIAKLMAHAESEQVKFRAAENIIDRAKGKPMIKQEVKHEFVTHQQVEEEYQKNKAKYAHGKWVSEDEADPPQ